MSATADQLNLPHLLRLIRITSHFQEDINQLQMERFGLSGYVAVRSNVHAIAKTCLMRSENGELGFAVVIDAEQIGQWSLNNPRCLTTIFHELCHVLFETHHLRALGTEEYVATPDTREQLLASKARLLLDEFAADRLVNSLVSAIAKKENGQPWSLREIEEAQGMDWVNSLLGSLARMARFIDEKVCAYRVEHGDIDKLTIEVIPYVTDVLTLLSHVAAIYMKTDFWQEIVNRIGETDACRRFMKEHLDIILAHLDDSSLMSDESVQGVADAIEGIFRNCGMGFRTVPEGLYISVGPPSL